MGPEPPDGPPVKRGRGRPRKDGLPPVQRKSPEPERAEGVDAADGRPLTPAPPRALPRPCRGASATAALGP